MRIECAFIVILLTNVIIYLMTNSSEYVMFKMLATYEVKTGLFICCLFI